MKGIDWLSWRNNSISEICRLYIRRLTMTTFIPTISTIPLFDDDWPCYFITFHSVFVVLSLTRKGDICAIDSIISNYPLGEEGFFLVDGIPLTVLDFELKFGERIALHCFALHWSSKWNGTLLTKGRCLCKMEVFFRHLCTLFMWLVYLGVLGLVLGGKLS